MRVLLLLLLLCAPAYADDHDWSTTDVTLEITYQVLRVMDWRQTVYISQHYPQYVEANSTLGENPSHGNVNRYMAILAISHLGITAILPNGFARTAWQSISIIEVGSAVMNNKSIGIGMSIHF